MGTKEMLKFGVSISAFSKEEKCQIVQIVDSFCTWTKNSRNFSGFTLPHAIRREKSIYDKKKSFENTYKLHENS